MILTLRADFYPDLMNSYLWPVDASQRVEVAPLRGESLREAIERPAADVGVRIEDKLVGQLLADAADEPGALPLLQETMRLLWDDIEHRSLPYGAYVRLSRGAGEAGSSLSGLAVAIAMKADATLAELDQSKQAIARRIFLRLIQFGEGRADTRRQQPVAALRSVNDGAGEFEQTLEHLTTHRLLTRSGGHDNTPPAVDISHESLIDGWSRLQDWADERREAEQIRRRLESKASEWVRLGKGTGGLLDEVALPEAERWLGSADAADLGFDAALPELVSASQPADAGSGPPSERDGGVPVAFSPESNTLATGSLNGIIRLWRPSDLTTPVASLRGHRGAMLALTFSDDGKYLASSGQDASVRLWDRSDPTAASVVLKNAGDPTNSLDFDPASNTLATSSFGGDGIRLWQLDKLDSPEVVLSGDFGFKVEFSPDGKTLAAGGAGFLKHWELEPSGQPSVLTGQGAIAFAFSPDMTLFASGGRSGDNAIRLWRWHDLDLPPTVLRGHEGAVNSLQFSADGKRLLSASWNGNSILLWDLTRPTPAPTALAVPDGMVPWTALFAPDGQSLIATGTGGVRAWPVADLSAESKVLLPTEKWASEIAVSPNGNTLASASFGPAVYLKDISRPDTPALELVGHSGPKGSYSVAFSPDGRGLASGGNTDASLRFWRLDKPNVPSIIFGRHNEGIVRVRFSPDGKQLASASEDRTVRLWQVENPGALPIILSGHQSGVWAMEYSHDGKFLVTGASKTIRVWDLTHPLNQSTIGEVADMACQKVWRNLTLDEWHKFVGVELPYERTCPNLPIHPSLFEAAEKMAKENDLDGAVALLKRIVELDPELGIDSAVEAQRLAESDTN